MLILNICSCPEGWWQDSWRIRVCKKWKMKTGSWMVTSLLPKCLKNCWCWKNKTKQTEIPKFDVRSDVEVWLGEHDKRESDGTEQHITSSKFIRHPDYNPRTHDADQTEPPCRSEQLCTPCCTAFKVHGPVLWSGHPPQCENAALIPFLHTDAYFSLFQRGALISCSAWRLLSWVMTCVLMRILSKWLKTWSVLAAWREGRTPVR